MKLKAIIILTTICFVMPSFVMATEVALNPDAPMYNQDEFNKNIDYGGKIKEQGRRLCANICWYGIRIFL